jgi:hypothetical protein
MAENPHPSSSLDLAPCDFFLFPKMEETVGPVSTLNSSLYITTPNITYINHPSGIFQQQPGMYLRKFLINSLKMTF